MDQRVIVKAGLVLGMDNDHMSITFVTEQCFRKIESLLIEDQESSAGSIITETLFEDDKNPDILLHLYGQDGCTEKINSQFNIIGIIPYIDE